MKLWAIPVAHAAICIALASCRSTSSDEWRASHEPGPCVGMPPVEAQATVRVVEKTTGAPLAGATIRLLEKPASPKVSYEDGIDSVATPVDPWKGKGHDIETDARGEVRVAAHALRIGVLVRKGELRGAWSPKSDAPIAIPEEITIVLEPATR